MISLNLHRRAPGRMTGPRLVGWPVNRTVSLGLYLRVGTVMIFCVEEDHEHEGDEADSGDAFDRRRSNLLDAEADLLRAHAERLIANGSISIERPAGMVTARFRGPVWRYHGGGAWHRRPGLDIEAIPADDSGRRAGTMPRRLV